VNILITGAKGQLGTELQKVIATGWAQIGQIGPEYAQARVAMVDLPEFDITDAAAVDAYLEGRDFDLIINCAAMTNVDACEGQEERAFAVNAQGPENLAKAAHKRGIDLMHISTDYVFSGEVAIDRVETDRPDPQSAYGRTKLAGEGLIQAATDRHYIVRTAWLYGLEGNNFVKTILRLANENGFVKVVDDQFGNPTSANDLAYEILRIALTKDYGIYHCTNNGTCSWYEFACAILDEMGIACERIPCSTAEMPRPAKRPAYSSLRNKHLEDTVGDEMRPWREALHTYIAQLKDREER
jgi:dTDP-4-dehydrorhamnose reductase